MARKEPTRTPGAPWWLPYVYSAPAMLLLGLMVVYPLGYGLYLGFTNMSLQNFFHFRFIGLRNFVAILTDPEFYSVLWRTVAWTAVNVFFHVTIGLWLAILLNRKLPGQPVFRTLLVLPWAIPQYIAALSWKTMFQYDFGAINLFLKAIGLPPAPWLSEPNWAFAAVIITNVWLGFPFMMMVSLGGLQSIPRELYEAADVDGASAWSKFREITLPLLRPVLIPAVTLGIVWTFNMVNVIYLVTGGGPGNSTDILVSYVYKAAFDFARYGYAAAFSTVIFLILLAFGVNFVRASRGTEGVY